MSTEYEYIIVGSGAGGGTLAARLAEQGRRVLVLEAGGDPMQMQGGDALYPATNRLPTDYEIPVLHPFSVENEAMQMGFLGPPLWQRRTPEKRLQVSRGVGRPTGGWRALSSRRVSRWLHGPQCHDHRLSSQPGLGRSGRDHGRRLVECREHAHLFREDGELPPPLVSVSLAREVGHQSRRGTVGRAGCKPRSPSRRAPSVMRRW